MVMWQRAGRGVRATHRGLGEGLRAGAELSQSSCYQRLPHPGACALPVTHLVGPDQGLHSQVVFHQFTGLGPAGCCQSLFRDDRKGLGLSQAVRGFLTGFPEEAVPGLDGGRNKKTAKLGMRVVGTPGDMVFLHHHSSQDLPKTLSRDPSQPAQAPIQSSDLSRTQLGRGLAGEL